MKFYGIRNKETKQALGFCCNSNGEDAMCNDVCFELEGFNCSVSNVWLVKNKETAQKVFEGQTKWYNAGYETPMISDTYFDKLKKDFEIFEIEI